MFYEGFGKSMKEEIKNYTYMLLCADGTYYTGWTNQIRKRIRAHNSGKGAKYTKGRGPLKLVYLEISDTKEAAMKREAAIKKLHPIIGMQRIKERIWEHFPEMKLPRVPYIG